MRQPPKSKSLLRALVVIFISLNTTSCAFFISTPEDEALEFARLGCGMEEKSDSGDFEFQYESDGTTWSFEKITLTELKDKKDLYLEFSKNATRAALLDSKWQQLSNALNEMSTFVSAGYDLKKNGETNFSRFEADDFNSPLLEWRNNCAAIAEISNS